MARRTAVDPGQKAKAEDIARQIRRAAQPLPPLDRPEAFGAAFDRFADARVVSAAALVPVDDDVTRAAAEALIREYLAFISDTARESYHLTFDVEAMIASDIGDAGKFYPPAGRFYVVCHGDRFVGVGCLKRLTPKIAEIQRMYVQPPARGLEAPHAHEPEPPPELPAWPSVARVVLDLHATLTRD